jgi:hypothetical protein
MVVVAELKLVVAEVAEVAVVLAHAAMARLLGVAGELVAEGLVAEEQKMGVNYNNNAAPFSTIVVDWITKLLTSQGYDSS